MRKKFYKKMMLALLLTCTMMAENLALPVMAEDASSENEQTMTSPADDTSSPVGITSSDDTSPSDSNPTPSSHSESDSACFVTMVTDTGGSPADNPSEDPTERRTANVAVNSQNIVYGDTFEEPIFSCDSPEAGVLGIIAGIDSNGNPYLSIDIPEVTLNDITGTDIPEIGEQSLKDYILDKLGDTFKLRDFIALLQFIFQLAGSESSNLISGLNQVMEIIDQIDESLLDTPIILNGRPTEIGVYTAIGITLNPAYNTAIGTGTLTITSRTANVTLAFNQDFTNDMNQIPYEQMYTFQFGGYVSEGDPQAADYIHTLYTGTSFDGESYYQEESPIHKPGIYRETIYLSDEYYFAVPVSRIYTIQRQPVDIRYDQTSVTARYDGNPHGLTAGVYAGDERIAEAEISYYYIGFKAGEIVYIETEQPTDVGIYLVAAAYLGDAVHQSAFSRDGSLIILDADAVISIEPVQHIVLNKTIPVEYSENEKTSAAGTGDSDDPAKYIVTLIIATFVIASILLRRHRNKNKS